MVYKSAYAAKTSHKTKIKANNVSCGIKLTSMYGIKNKGAVSNT